MTEQLKTNNLRYFFSSVAFVLFSIVSALTIGLVIGAVGTFVYLVIIFPVVVGFLGGKMITDNAKYTRVRNASLIRWTGIISAVVIFVTIFFIRFVGEQVKIAWVFGGLSDENLKVANIVVNYELEQQTGHTGFVGYVLFKAKQGVFIGRMLRDNAFNLGPIFTWLYWLAEVSVIAFIMAYTSREISQTPFCENCNTWYEGKGHIGGIPLVRELEVMNLIRRHEYDSIGKMLEENVNVPGLELYLQSCKTCEKSDSFLTVSKTRMDKGRLVFADLLNNALAPRERKLLQEGIDFSGNQAKAMDEEIAMLGRTRFS